MEHNSTGKAPVGLMPRVRRLLLRGSITQWLRRRLGLAPTHLKVRWYGANSTDEAYRALSRWAAIFIEKSPDPTCAWVISLGEHGDFHHGLDDRLSRKGIRHRSLTLDQASQLTMEEVRNLAGILCGFRDARQMTTVARALALHPILSRVPFEYAAGVTPEQRIFAMRDEYRDTFFVAPALNDRPGPYAIYEESLRYFGRKCGLRDYLDLYQFLKVIVENKIPGDVAEFGSYRGHSGWLIARTLDALGSKKRVFLFDTFEGFPSEPYGLDHFWNKSHTVNYEEVRSKFIGVDRVTLVKGDFTQTLQSSEVTKLALAYVDCDSYRATRYLIKDILSSHLSIGGMLIVEDYGHPALLGSRAAVHEELDHQTNCLRYFSQFSGLYVAIKLNNYDTLQQGR